MVDTWLLHCECEGCEAFVRAFISVCQNCCARASAVLPWHQMFPLHQVASPPLCGCGWQSASTRIC